VRCGLFFFVRGEMHANRRRRVLRDFFPLHQELDVHHFAPTIRRPVTTPEVGDFSENETSQALHRCHPSVKRFSGYLPKT
jgi:hypothetical protein